MSEESKPQKSDARSSYDLDAIHLQIGAKLQLITEQTSRPQHYFASLIGYLAGVAVLVRTPTENGLSVTFKEGEPLTVRVFSGIHVYSFKTFVDRVLSSPFPCLYLGFPKSVSGIVLRKAMRVKVDIPVQATRSTAGEPSAASLTDLSIIGGLIESDTKLGEVLEQIQISFAFIAQPGDREVRINTKAVIRNLKELKADSPEARSLYGHGIEFLGMDATEQVMLQDLIYESFVGNRLSVV